MSVRLQGHRTPERFSGSMGEVSLGGRGPINPPARTRPGAAPKDPESPRVAQQEGLQHV